LIESDPHHAFGFDSFPVIDLIKALCTVCPADGARLWSALWPHYGISSWSLPRFEQVPFSATDPIFSSLRDRVLAAALSDAKIETVVTVAAGNGHLDWLFSQMDMLLAAPTAGEIARGLTIARFLDPSPEADAAWQRVEAMPLSSWLAKIRSRARTEYNHGRMAQASGSRFMTGSDPDQLLADLVLFKQTADTHDLDILRESADNEGFDTLSPAGRAFWLEWRDALKASAKKSSEGRDKRYLYDEPPKTTHRPWHS
jgi:hypothetical protein